LIFLTSFVAPQFVRTCLARSIIPLFTAESIFEVPEAFSDFQDPGLSFVTTLPDPVKGCAELPRLLVLLQYLGFAQHYNMLSFGSKSSPATRNHAVTRTSGTMSTNRLSSVSGGFLTSSGAIARSP
jgi:hypothetical protein